MKSASNMMAKWYQMPRRLSPPRVLAKICAMPTASDGAPPVRFRSEVSPTDFARLSMVAASTGYPHDVILLAASTEVDPMTPAGELMAKYTPG